MELNFLVFPAPKPSYNAEILENELIWIPAYKEGKDPQSPLKKTSEVVSVIVKEEEIQSRYKYYLSLGLLNKKASIEIRKEPSYYIPCLLLRPSNSFSPFILLYFHGNGEDVFLAYDLLNNLRNNLQINVLAIEYPGYGIYKESCSAERIKEDAIIVYDYILNLGFKNENIFCLGRSIGTGAALELAVRKQIGVLALVSPFTSLREVVKEMVGGIFKFFLKERFDNLVNISKIKCPILIVHGLLDTMIPVDHSFHLHGIFNSFFFKLLIF